MDVSGKKILITGSSSGIGEVLSSKLISEGATVIKVSRTDGFDLTSPSDIEKLVTFVKEKYGQIDILVHSAGVGIYKGLKSLSIEEWEQSLALNLTAPFILTKDLLPKSLVITLGSKSGVMGIKGRPAYCASKFGLRGLMLSLAQEFQGVGPDFCLITLVSTLTNFGSLKISEKLARQAAGDCSYLTPDFVADKIIEIIKSDKREPEYVFNPENT